MVLLQKILLFLIAICILNQSIDFDYATFGSVANQREIEYDDVDCLLEFVVEAIAGDDGFTSETDDDSGIPHNKGLEKQNSALQFSEQPRKIKVEPSLKYTYAWLPGLDQSNNICKGFTRIVSPPPKA